MKFSSIIHPSSNSSTPFQGFARWAAFVTSLIGALALVGWVFDVGALRHILPGAVDMKTSTALCLLLSGFSLGLLSEETPATTPTNWRKYLGRAGAVAVFLIGSLTLSQYLFGWSLGIDQLLAREAKGAFGTLFPKRMAPTSALNFVLIGAALLLLNRPSRRSFDISQALTLTAALIALPALVGYLYRVMSFYGIAQFTQMALPTALAFIVLCAGLLCARPSHGVAQVVSGDTIGGDFARLMLPLMVALPLGIGWLQLHGEQANFFDSRFATALRTSVDMVIYATLIWRAALWLHRRDAERERTQESLRQAHDELEERVRERTQELTRANDILRESEEKYRSITQATSDAVLIADSQGKIVSWNNGARAIFGFEEAEIKGRSLTLLMPEEFQDAHQGGLERVSQGGERRVNGMVEVVGQRKDGSEFPLELALGVWETSHGNFYSGIMRDISKRKQVEEERNIYALRLERSNRELQNFASVASHDLQEPLRKVRAFGDRLQEECAQELSEDGRYYLERMQDAAMRMSTLINDLLAYSRITTKAQPFTPVDLSTIAHEVLEDLQIAIEESGARIEVGELPTIEADALQMRQLMQNLLGNALKFRRPDEPPFVQVSSKIVTEDNLLALTVRDNGIGFDLRYLARIFGIFQRLHGRKEYEGSGIGLSICRKIAERHGGDITAQSAPNQGATFVVTLPLRHPEGDTYA